jgi:hypothetical protein
MRGLWRLLAGSLIGALLIGCGAVPDAQATQTRTSEIVELTVAARLLPTQNAAIPPTPIPATPTSPMPTSIPTPFSAATNSGSASATSAWATINALPSRPPDIAFGGSPAPPLLPGSWVAYAAALHVRFFAPPSLVEAPDLSNDHRYSLGSPSNVYDFEALDVYRYVGIRGGDFAKTWTNEIDTFRGSPNVTALVVTSDPRQQQVGAFQGNIGQFHYFQQDNDLKVSGTMWVGQIGGDEAIIIYRCTPDRESQLDAEMAQILRTIDFNAR